MIHLLEHPIEYKSQRFGIFGLESMRVIEGIYAYNHSLYSNVDDPIKCFLIKNGRIPNKAELEYQQKLREGEPVPLRSYWFNWCIYCTQNILLQNHKLMPSTKTILKEVKRVFNHRITDEYLHTIAKLVRFNTYDLRVAYYGVNVWQTMTVVAALDSINAQRSAKSIRLLFNKIYKREPLQREIDCCSQLKLTTSEEIRNEIESFGPVFGQKVVAAKRSPW